MSAVSFEDVEGVWFHTCLHERIVFSWPTKHVPFPVME